MSVRKRTWTTADGEERTAWVVDYKDGAGKRRLKTFSRKKDADAWAPQTAVDVRKGVHTPESESVTVAEAAKLWLSRAELEGRERSTCEQYRQHVELHINPLIGGTKLARLTTPAVEGIRDKLVGTMSRPMAKKVLGSLKSILTEAQRRGLVAHNAASPVKIEIAGRHKRKLKVGEDIPTKGEAQRIIEAAQGRWRPLLVTAVFTGLRASELRGLTWNDVDFETRTIHVRQRADRYNEIGSPKSHAGERDVPMSPIVINTLREWKLQCPASDLGLAFPNGKGNIEALANVFNRGFAPAQVAAGVAIDTGEKDEDGKPIMKAKYGMHALRHFCASWLIEQGFPPKRLQSILGHSSIQMTFDTYGHLFPAEQDDFDRLAAGELSVMNGGG